MLISFFLMFFEITLLKIEEESRWDNLSQGNDCFVL